MKYAHLSHLDKDDLVEILFQDKEELKPLLRYLSHISEDKMWCHVFADGSTSVTADRQEGFSTIYENSEVKCVRVYLSSQTDTGGLKVGETYLFDMQGWHGYNECTITDVRNNLVSVNVRVVCSIDAFKLNCEPL